MKEVLGWYGYERQNDIKDGQPPKKISKIDMHLNTEQEEDRLQDSGETSIDVAEEVVESESKSYTTDTSVIIKQEPPEELRVEELNDQKWRSPVIVKNEVFSPEIGW
ncbi:uncharacterized protein LOC113376226 [Ctenocephalides felis]|uniref:uncharacterized protein LOC113376226 n=1 Tax=Ctenocephalides felis TaxID=7515 RepID=UPI000E6E36C6|nr:uncharacterized protein LOC113376226 [Ctenocephalides felis]